MRENVKAYMQRFRYRLGYFLIPMLMFLMVSIGYAATDALLNAKLEEAIADVRMSVSPMQRSEAAEHLADLTHRAKPNSVDDKTIADMVSLLDIPDDSVRGWTAAALGQLGRRARAAAPKLLALLPQVDCLDGDLTSAAAIRPALEKMGVKVPQEPSYNDCHKTEKKLPVLSKEKQVMQHEQFNW